MPLTLPERIHARGLSLIELMIAMALGLLIVLGVTNIFVNTGRSVRQDERLSRLQEELRFGTARLTQDIELAGFWSSLFNPGAVQLDPSLTALTVSNDCGPAVAGEAASSPRSRWAFGNLQPLQYVDNASATTAAAAFPCIASDEIRPNTDIIAIKKLFAARAYRYSGVAAVESRQDMAANRFYLKTNGALGYLFLQEAVGSLANPTLVPAIPTPYDYWEYSPAVYFIRNYSVSPGDNIPSLCRKMIDSNGSPRFESECIATGIEDLQIEYGIDLRDSTGAVANASNPPDGTPEYFTSNPSAAELSSVSTVRIWLIARAAEADRSYRNQKSYIASNSTIGTPNDNFYRRVQFSTVLVRNPTSLRKMP